MYRWLMILVPLCCFDVHAQDTWQLTPTSSDLTYTGSHTSFSIIPCRNTKATIKRISGPYTPGSTMVTGGEAGFNYHYHPGKYASFVLGLHGGVSVGNYTLIIPKSDLNTPGAYPFEIDPRSSREVAPYVSLPVFYERRFFTRAAHHWNISAGINIRYNPVAMGSKTSYEVMDSSGQNWWVLEIDLATGGFKRPWVDYNIGGGYNWLLKNNNIFRLNLLLNISDRSITTGSYRINVPNKPVSTGNYFSEHSYVGLSLNYIFTRTNKRMQRVYEMDRRLRRQ